MDGKEFDLSFVMAKQSIPFAKYPALLEFKQLHKVDIGYAYNTVVMQLIMTHMKQTL